MKKPVKKSSSGIQVIDRMTQLLDAIARYTGPVSLKILAAETGLHSSTVFRILGALTSHGFVERDESGGYRLGRRLLQLGARVRSDVDIRQEALPAMEWLRDQVGESVNLTIREGDEVIYVERATTNRMMRVEQVIGSRAPLHVTAVGKIMLGFEGPDAIREYARRTGLRAFTPNTLDEPGRSDTCRRRRARARLRLRRRGGRTRRGLHRNVGARRHGRGGGRVVDFGADRAPA